MLATVSRREMASCTVRTTSPSLNLGAMVFAIQLADDDYSRSMENPGEWEENKTKKKLMIDRVEVKDDSMEPRGT